MKTFKDDDHCFVCGSKNRIGLNLKFHPAGKEEGILAMVNFPVHFQGWKKVVHGGLISTVLDEIMIKAAAFKGFQCLTAEITVRFKKPARTSRPLILKGRVAEDKGKILITESELTDSSGCVFASAKGRLFKIE